MRYFKVEHQEIVGDILMTYVDSDGDPLELPDTIEVNETRSLGYIVTEYNEAGELIDTYYGYTDIEQIKKDFPAPEWQNHDW